MKPPYRPSVHCRGGSRSPRIRFDNRQAMHMVYEVREPPLLRVNNALRAAVDPRLISESKTATTIDMMTALTGTFQPGATYVGQLGLK